MTAPWPKVCSALHLLWRGSEDLIDDLPKSSLEPPDELLQADPEPRADLMDLNGIGGPFTVLDLRYH
jgi:hypothetical protein